MSVYHGVDGTVLAVNQEFLNDDDTPLIPASGYPKVRLLDKNKDLLVSVNASPSSEAGTWTANLPVPRMDLEERTEFTIQWRFKDNTGSKHRATEVALIEPAVDQRYGDIVMMHGDPDAAITMPLVFGDDWTGYWQAYLANEACVVNPPAIEDLERKTNLDNTVFTLPTDQIPYASLVAYLVNMQVRPSNGRSRTYNYKLWSVTPQIMKGMSDLEDFLNKARIENVIPELRYGDSDLMNYLERGLYMFNRVGYPTGFNGTNMQGSLYDCWIICSCYYALSAQILAEGSLSFDFSGQGVSLNVDRTPALEGALGRIESQIEGQVVPLKKILNTQGITVGDGSVGSSNLNNPASHGTLGIMNAATTRLPMYANMFVGRRR